MVVSCRDGERPFSKCYGIRQDSTKGTYLNVRDVHYSNQYYPLGTVVYVACERV